MKLSKKWTTVTPLSKALALALYILLPILGFYLGRYYQFNVDKYFFNTNYVTFLHSK